MNILPDALESIRDVHTGNILLDRIEPEYRKFAFHAFRETEFVLAELGNGCLGLRSATEEKYLSETRDLLVAGTASCTSTRWWARTSTRSMWAASTKTITRSRSRRSRFPSRRT